MKRYILDTNVVLYEAASIFKFAEHQVVIPITVIEEVDRFKKQMDDLGRNARHFTRFIDELRKLGSLSTGVPVNGEGGTLQVALYTDDMAISNLDMSVPDHRILAVAKAGKGVLISKDVNLRVKADAFGVPASDYENSKVDVEKLYTGSDTMEVDHATVEALYANGKIRREETGIEEFPPNHCFVLQSSFNPKQAVLCRYDAVMKEFVRLPQDFSPCGLLPRSAEQQFALDLLTDPKVELVSLVGLAGSGKTLLAIAAGLSGVLETKLYKKMLLLKPIVSMGNSHQLGFLPGSMEEKLAPWMSSFYDNIEFLMGDKKQEFPKVQGSKRKASRVEKAVEMWDDEKVAGKMPIAQELISRNFIELGSLEHLRGRSLPGQYIIVDEAQNLTPAALKTVVSRAGEGTKIILLGDIQQIDSPYLDASSNGLVYVADRFKNETLSGHLLLRNSERSRLAERAAELL